MGVCRITPLVTAPLPLPPVRCCFRLSSPYSEEDPGDRSGYRGPWCAAACSCRRG
ncbi:hypothetical protein H4W33_003080 [Kibdelosporangium phytohabitans]|nr:hypothetical protein [Kibdelosporangium phytohabitans]